MKVPTCLPHSWSSHAGTSWSILTSTAPHQQQFWLQRVEISHRPDFIPVTAALWHTSSLCMWTTHRQQGTSKGKACSAQCFPLDYGNQKDSRPSCILQSSLSSVCWYRIPPASQVCSWTRAHPYLTLRFILGTNSLSEKQTAKNGHSRGPYSSIIYKIHILTLNSPCVYLKHL